MEIFYISFLGYAFSVLLFIAGKRRPALALLFLSSLFTFSNAALLDGFVSMWDERFHALVAKNLMNHPFVPTLYGDPVLDMVYAPWDRYHIWLHKPPLFLWQIALSFKLFGVNEFSLRLPSIIMASLLVLIIYRSGKLLVNQQTGFYAALLAGSSYYLMELVAGRKTLEHNDVAFIFYVSASLWAWIEHLFKKKEDSKKWIFLAGLFSGFAILTKWLPGLLVYLGWGIYFLLRNKKSKRDWLTGLKEMTLSFIITLFTVLPWQLYTWIRFPEEKALQMEIYSDHFKMAFDGHDGGVWFHFLRISDLYGSNAVYLIIPAIIAFYYFARNKKLNLSLLVMALFVYLFYSVAKTKMPTFTYILILPVVISFGSLVFATSDMVKKFIPIPIIQKVTIGTLMLLLCWFNMNLKTLQQKHDPEGNAAKYLTHNKMTFISLKNTLPMDAVVFNVRGRHFIECMFYSGFTAYGIVPTVQQVDEMKNKGRTVAVFDTHNLPEYLYDDTEVILIHKELQGWD